MTSHSSEAGLGKMKRIMKREGSRGRVRGERWDDPKISLRDL